MSSPSLNDPTPRERMVRERQDAYESKIKDVITQVNVPHKSLNITHGQLKNFQAQSLPQRLLAQQNFLQAQFNNGLNPLAFRRQINADHNMDTRSYRYGN
jgi:hypothetical protein